MHTIHNLVAGVCTKPAANALVLKAITNVNACGADFHADAAVNTVAFSRGGMVFGL
jgi:hypothetical protein